jgi:hypothetical protein
MAHPTLVRRSTYAQYQAMVYQAESQILLAFAQAPEVFSQEDIDFLWSRIQYPTVPIMEIPLHHDADDPLVALHTPPCVAVAMLYIVEGIHFGFNNMCLFAKKAGILDFRGATEGKNPLGMLRSY